MPRLTGKRVLVIGDVMADHYVWGRVERISPEAPIPVVHVTREEVRPGGAANVACNIAALGGQVVLAGVVGADAMAGTLCGLLQDKGINPSGVVRDPERPTIQKTRVLAGHQQVVRVDRERQLPLCCSVSESFRSACLNALEQVDAVLLSDYAKGTLSAELCAAVIQKGRAIGGVVTADPKPANIDWYSGSTLVTPNQAEAQSATGVAIEDDHTAEAAGRLLLHRLGSASVLITRGEHGMSLLQKNGSTHHIPAKVREVFDVTGAGDTVIATLTLALAAGATLLQASTLANIAAGIVVGEIGVAVVTPAELERTLIEKAWL